MAGRARNNKGPAPLIRADPFLDFSGSQNDGRCRSPGCWEKTGAHPQQYEPVFHDLNRSFVDYQHRKGHFISARIAVSTIMVPGHCVTRLKWHWATALARCQIDGYMKHITVPFLANLAKILSGATVRWVECEPDICQRVYFANHTSHLDALVLWASLPKQLRNLTRPVAAADYWQAGPVRRYMATVFNALLIDRTKIKVHNSPIDMMIREISNKYSLIVFPEGGRNPTGELRDFKSGLYYLGKKRPDLELVPVYFDNLNRVMPKGEFLPVPLLSCISIGPPIWLEAGEGKNDFLTRARQAVLNLKER